ncbi:DMP19 family protein [Cyclobacterium plantarum]|uniref:DMP19 family protein n=1 Tax=Cyclobacterium plantarum TaxID=2716263 RepID=UPI003F6E86DD
MTRTLIVMGIISTILNLFGCSGHNKNDDAAQKTDFDNQIAESIEAFKNRPIQDELTNEIIDYTSDDELLQVVFDNLTTKLPDNYEKEYETVKTWNRSRQAIYLIWILEAEVNNGGYNQFYFNSSGLFYKELPVALRLVGANKFADLTERANKIYETENQEITKHQDGTIEGFSKSYEDNPLNDLDNEFYELYQTENLQQIQVDYIRQNKNDFTDK